MANAAIANGIIEDKSENRKLSCSYVRPEIDLSDVPTADAMVQQLQSL